MHEDIADETAVSSHSEALACFLKCVQWQMTITTQQVGGSAWSPRKFSRLRLLLRQFWTKISYFSDMDIYSSFVLVHLANIVTVQIYTEHTDTCSSWACLLGGVGLEKLTRLCMWPLHWSDDHKRLNNVPAAVRFCGGTDPPHKTLWGGRAPSAPPPFPVPA